MPVLVLSNDWKSEPDSDGIWIVFNEEAQESRVVSLWAEPRHESGWSTDLGDEWVDDPDYVYAKLAEFSSGTKKRFKGRPE